MPNPQMPETEHPQSVAEVREGLEKVGYLADESAALVSFLAQRLGKPVLVEGPGGRRQDRARQGALAHDAAAT